MSRVFVYFLLPYFLATVLCSSTVKDQDREGYCKIGDVYIKEGEKGAAPLGQCMRIECKDAATNTHMGIGCGLMHPGPKCRMSNQDLTRRYPECCPQVICDE